MKVFKSILFSLFFLISCEKDSGSANSDILIRVKVVNSLGQDLLNSPVTFDKDNITVTQIVDGKMTVYTGAHLGSGFNLYKTENNLNMLTVVPTLNGGRTVTTTLLKLGTAKVDTIKCDFIRTNNSIYCSKVWLNDVLQFSDDPQTNQVPRILTIVK